MVPWADNEYTFTNTSDPFTVASRRKAALHGRLSRYLEDPIFREGAPQTGPLHPSNTRQRLAIHVTNGSLLKPPRALEGPPSCCNSHGERSVLY